MIYLGVFKAADTVFYAANFHNDTGILEDPTSPEAQIRNSAGTWSALTAPAKQNSKTGHYGGTVDTAGFSVGQHIIRMAGTVATAKTVATEFCFMIVANIESDTYEIVNSGTYGNAAIKGYVDDIGVAGAGLTALGDTRIANLDATVSSRLATSGYNAPDNTSISAIKAKTDNLPTDPASDTQVNTRLATSGYTAPDNTSISAIKVKTDTIVWANVTSLLDEAIGKWSIDKNTNVMTLYKQDGVTILKQFNLTDTALVSERVPI